MKAVAINASPRMDKGVIAMILAPFLDGMKEAGAEIEIYYTKRLDIKPCQAEFACQR
jgi:multimeric flavodoxin WrbA